MTRAPARRMVGRGPVLGYTAVAASFWLAGCSMFDSPDAQYGGICVDQVTQQRVDDSRCGDWDDDGFYSGAGTYMLWYPMTYGGDVPAVGQRATGGVTRVPAGAPIAKGVPKQGATGKAGGMTSIKRGGFGAKAGTSGGTGAKAKGTSSGS